MKLRFSAADWCYLKDGSDATEYYPGLKSAGVSAVEMVSVERRAAARAAGLPVIDLSGPGMVEGLNRRENHEALVPEIEAAIQAARSDGIPNLIVFSGNRFGSPDDEGIEACVEAFRLLAPVAEKAGVTLLFEMLCAMDHPGYQADSSAYGFSVVERVASPGLRVLYDIYHMYRMGENVIDDLIANLPIIGHIHVAESPLRDLPVPGGAIDYPAIVGKVMDAGYDGYWGLEFLPRSGSFGTPGSDVYDEIAAAISYFRGGSKSR
jgi:hydroxypyruvate isomerase